MSAPKRPTVHLGDFASMGLLGRSLDYAAKLLKASNTEYARPCARCGRRRQPIIGDMSSCPHYQTANLDLCDDCDDPTGERRKAHRARVKMWEAAHPAEAADGAHLGATFPGGDGVRLTIT